MTVSVVQLLIAAPLAVLAVVLLQPRPAARRRVRSTVVLARTAPDAPAEHLRQVADTMFDEADALLAEAADRRCLGLDADAAELRERAHEIEAVTYLVIEEARRLLGQRPPRWPSERDEPAA